jgi:hypothetical protein
VSPERAWRSHRSSELRWATRPATAESGDEEGSALASKDRHGGRGAHDAWVVRHGRRWKGAVGEDFSAAQGRRRGEEEARRFGSDLVIGRARLGRRPVKMRGGCAAFR